MRTTALAVALTVATPVLALAQDDAGLSSLMAACSPIAATGESIRADLSDAGWSAETVQSGIADMLDLIGSHMWSFMADAPVDAQLGAVNDVAVALRASLADPVFGEIYTRPGEVVVLLTQGVNISCFWAGGEGDIFAARVADVGGFPTPDAPSAVTTASRIQTVEAGGQDWTRIESYAVLTEDGRAGPYPAAARLDRSPVQ